MDHFAEALAAIREMKAEGVVAEYAVGGAMAFVFWSEPTSTFDLDIFVLQRRGYPEQAEHIVIAGVPVQVIPAHNELTAEAIATAADLEYENQPVRVIRPEYLIAMYLEGSARTRKRLERVGALLDAGAVDRQLLDSLLARYNLHLPPEP